MIVSKRWTLLYAALFLVLFLFYKVRTSGIHFSTLRPHQAILQEPGTFHWDALPQHYPVTAFISLPSGQPKKHPAIQFDFPRITDPTLEARRRERLMEIRASFEHAWNGYKKCAWAKDEVAPLSGRYYNTFGGWAATLVDSLDSLWILGFKEDFELAVVEVEKLDFSTSLHEELNIFETTIRYIGGLLSAYDLSGKGVLLRKAVELGNMMYVAFDTPNRMPITRWKWQEYDRPNKSELRPLTVYRALNGSFQEAQDFVISAEVGSLSLEFTRLS